MLRAVALLLAASAAVAAPVPKGVKRVSLDGQWELVEQNYSGQNQPNFAKWMWVIEGEQLSFRRPDKEGVYQPSETHEQATLRRTPDGRAGEIDYSLAIGGHTTQYRTLVEQNGDELRVCFENTGDAERPAEVKPAPRILYFRFKRVMEK